MSRKKHTKLGTPLTQCVSGTRDFLPPQHAVLQYIQTKWSSVARNHGFQSYETPVVEQFELFRKKMTGKEDLAKQMFVWSDVDPLLGNGENSSVASDYQDTDKPAAPVLCLRPEMTPSIARLVMQQGKKLIKPIKYFSIAQCWRNEQVTRGRKREHYQWNCDIWGIKEVYAEAELLSLLYNLFKQVNLHNDISIRISSRKLLQSLLWDLNSKEFVEVCCILDRIDKMEESEIRDALEELGLSKHIVERIFEFVRIDTDTSLEEALDRIGALISGEGEGTDAVSSSNHGSKLFQEASREIKLLYELASSYGYANLLKFDPSIVRGLSYYTGIVFEVFSETSSLQRAVCGGGRYDNLLTEAYGYSENVPAVGFGFGDVVLTELLEEKGLLPKELGQPFVDDLILPFDDEMRVHAVRLAQKFRSHQTNRIVDLYLGNTKKMKQMFNYADRIGAQRVVLIAPDEWSQGKVRIKYLREDGRPQYNVAVEDLLHFEENREKYQQEQV